MVRKKIDNRLRVLIENGVSEKHRSMFVVVGDHGRDQVVILHHMLSKAVVRARPNVLWCYKKELGFSSHRKKRMKQLQKKIKHGKLDVKEDDPFELFVSATDIRYCYYAETHKILGNTYGMCILQDFEALTPNLLARTIETVEGGGIVVILLRTMASLKQLYTMTMDVHSRFRTEAHQDVVGRFNERFLLSMVSCKNCMVIDDQFNILPLSSQALNIQPVPAKSLEDSLSPQQQELRELKDSLQDTQPVGSVLNCCKTLDQGKALLKFVEAISEKTLRSTVVMTAARGRGKSAALGLAMATAVGFGYSNIFVTAPSPENLKTVFEFIFKGFDTLEYQEHLDYEIIQSTNPEFNKAIVRVNIFREHRQTIQYIHPGDSHKLGQAELVCVDEAAAIPLPLVKNLLGPYLVFMSSTINGYEGTGRSLSLKLIHQLRQQSATFGKGSKEVQKAANMASKPESVSSASAKDKLFNSLLQEWKDTGDGFPVSMSEKGMADQIQIIMNALWYISGNVETINERSIHMPAVKPVPQRFWQYRDVNDYKKKKQKKPVLQSKELKLHSQCLFKLSARPFVQKWVSKDDIEKLAVCLDQYSRYLDSANEKQKLRQMEEKPLRIVDDHISVGHHTKTETIPNNYRQLDSALQELDDFQPLFFDEEVHLSKAFENSDQRYKFFREIKLTNNFHLLRYDPGGGHGVVSFLWKVPLELPSDEMFVQDNKVLRGIRSILPEYHTRQMRREFYYSYENIAGVKIPPYILRSIYSSLTNDATPDQNPDIDERVRMSVLGSDPDLVVDLRHLNKGAPGDTFNTFFEQLEKEVNDITAADERRHGIEHVSKYLSVRDMIESVKGKLDKETPIPSESTILLAFVPKNAHNKVAKLYKGRVPLRLKVQTRQLRSSHIDEHFCACLFKYLREYSVKIKELCTLVCMDDKAKVDYGEPGLYASTGVRGKKSIVPVNSTLSCLDHDVHNKGSLTPSVVLEVDIPDEITDSFYRGQVTVTIKDSVFEASSPFRHIVELQKILESKTEKKPCLFIYTDGGPDHRTTYHAVKLSLIVLFKRLQLEFLVACRTAPGNSWSNPAERIMSLLNLAYQNTALARDDCSAEIEQSIRGCSGMADIRKRAEKVDGLKHAWMKSVENVKMVLHDRTERVRLKDKPFKCQKPAGPDEVEMAEAETTLIDPAICVGKYQQQNLSQAASYKQFLADHCLERQYCFQIRRCNNAECCPPASKEWIWLPDPVMEVRGEHYKSFETVYGTDTTEKDRPSFQNQTLAAVAEEQQGCKNSVLTAQNVRMIINCSECGKPRCVYSKLKLTPRDNRALKHSLEKHDYSCGSVITADGRVLHEVVLNESIRYANGDPVEKWLNDLLCLDAASVPRISSGCPLPETCDLYYVNRDTLFSYHKAAESFLHRIMALYVSSHYKNSPNDLQMLSDAPAHHIFVLLGPVDPNQSSLPEVLCVLQVCLEGEISKSTIMNSLSRGKRASGDLIPWTVSQQFQDHDFPGLSGARVVRIATHPEYQGMGYGTRALKLLGDYYEGNIPNLAEQIDVEEEITTVGNEDVSLLEESLKPRKNMPPLMMKLSERRAEKLDYLGVSYGLTAGLLKFWKKAGFTPVYLRQTPNDLTGEHSCIMLKMLNETEEENVSDSWLCAFWKDFRRRFVSLLSYQFRSFTSVMSLSILQQKHFKQASKEKLTRQELDVYLTKYDLKRLELYSQNMVDYHLIVDLLPTLSRLYFLDQLDVHLSAVQSGILIGIGLQHKTIDDLQKDLDLPTSQLLGLFSRIIRKLVQHLNGILEKDVEKGLVAQKEVNLQPMEQSMEDELNEAAEVVKAKQKKDLAIMKDLDLSQYQIRGSEQDWQKALTVGSGKGLVSVKGGLEKKRKPEESKDTDCPGMKKKKNKKHKH